MSEDFIDSIITNLKIIGLIQINEKLSIRKGHLQIDRDSNLQFFKRWLNRDSRDIVINYIKDLNRNVNLLYQKIREKNEYPDKLWILTRIVTELDKVEQGLSNLKTTYTSDTVTEVILDNLIVKFRETASNIRSLLVPPHKETSLKSSAK